MKRRDIEKQNQPEGGLWLAVKVRLFYLGRRLESTEPASCFVALLVLGLFSAFDAFEATPREVLTEFFAMSVHLLSIQTWTEKAGEERRRKGGAEGSGIPLRKLLYHMLARNTTY